MAGTSPAIATEHRIPPPMDILTIAFLVGVGVIAGIIAAIVGGAAVVIYPALIATGVPPHLAAVSNLADWNSVTPRFAAVFDVTGDGKTLAKLSVGRYVVAPNASVGLNSNPNSSPWWRKYEWTDPNRSGVFESGEEGRSQGSRGGRATESLDPGLKLPIVDEAGAWIERTLAGDNRAKRDRVPEQPDRSGVPVQSGVGKTGEIVSVFGTVDIFVDEFF